MSLTRQVYQEQDAMLVARIPRFMKVWLIKMADEITDRSMSDFVRDGIRLVMEEHGYDETGERTMHKKISFEFRDAPEETEHEQPSD